MTPHQWPLRSYLELGALPTAVPCARLHARHLLWEWGLNETAADTELLVSELVTNAVKATAGQQQAAIRLQLSSDNTCVRVEVWDADPHPPVPKGRHPRPPGRRRPRPVPGGGAEFPLGLVPHPRATRQGRLVRTGSQIRTAGITTPASRLPPSPMNAAAHGGGEPKRRRLKPGIA